MTDSRYSIISSQDTYTYTNQAIWPVFNVVYDQDGDLVNDNLESQLAQKFSPVLHKHSFDKQAGLSSIEWILSGRSSLIAYNELGQQAYNATMANPSQVHYYFGNHRDSFGSGDWITYWLLDIQDSYRYQSAPSGQKPLYYHVYKSGNYYYVQYWYFLAMNDLQDQTNNHTWHEGEFEHVSIKVSASSLAPVAVNFYRHEGGRTVSASNCWWSSSNSLTYSGLSKGYSSSRTHLHIWIAANSHASYNRNHEVYSITASADVDLCIDLVDEYYIDNVDYNPSGSDLYFPYDYLENLGEYQLSYDAHGYPWFSHYGLKKSMGKPWISFVGRFGLYWAETCLGSAQATVSPLSPIFDLSGKPSHEWTKFTENYNPLGFGNPLEYPPFTLVSIFFTNDPSTGD